MDESPCFCNITLKMCDLGHCKLLEISCVWKSMYDQSIVECVQLVSPVLKDMQHFARLQSLILSFPGRFRASKLARCLNFLGKKYS